MECSVYNCELVYDNFETVWKEFQPYSAHLKLLKNQSFYCNEAKLIILLWTYVGLDKVGNQRTTQAETDHRDNLPNTIQHTYICMINNKFPKLHLTFNNMISLIDYEVTELYGIRRKLIWMFLDRLGFKYFLKD